MLYTRRDVGKIALAAGAASKLMGAAKPDSHFGGVWIGAITYSFRALPVADTLKYCVECGIDGVELMSDAFESWAGRPAQPGRGGPGAPGGMPPGGPGAPGGPGGARGGRAPLTPEQIAAQQKAAEDLKKWRLGLPMSKVKEFRKMYNDAGVQIYAFKLPPTMAMSDDEWDFIWNVGETLGASHLTMELPAQLQNGELVWQDDLLRRVGAFASRRKFKMAFHAHGQGGEKGFQKALDASPYLALNLDVGHFYGVNGVSPVPVVEKYHDRIASLHLKDRKGPNSGTNNEGRGGGDNMPWGQGETPLKDVLQLMKTKKYKFPASIEYEYQTPQGSDVLTEMKKCVQYCRQALA